MSFIGAQAHLEKRLVGAESYKVLKIIHCRISSTEKIEEDVKLQSIILCFLFFFRRMKTRVKVSMKVQRIAGALSRMSI